ncbi:Calcium-activated chloride channel regulator 1 [Orchesella cincta]|uniref:Calcium-activated chloride channel regulator 1 n=1 Tax=Orchesella cincta TaxID=48709 RepID=A0A1D2NIL9_ORCCI|nr:Calcium-activated chloride channel regulator 1 [Orchesella cincta]
MKMKRVTGRIRIISFLILQILLIISTQHGVAGKTTSIKFENGVYNGIVIGIDEDITTDCVQLLDSLKSVLPIFSLKLHEATSGNARIGTVDILIPFDWDNGKCGLAANETSPALPSYSYFNSDLKITSVHPFANSLPWTNQYKPCGQGGDSIVLPPQFLDSDGGLSNSIKAQILLHEWTKFRYGAFDEIGYDGDPQFPPCYSRSQSGAEMTCCTRATLTSVEPSECTLSSLMGKKDSLNQELSQNLTSVMSTPYMDIGAHFCNKTTHNGWPNTKQNVYCKRRSVNEVVNEHPDFKLLRSNSIHQGQPETPQIRYVKHSRRTFQPAYAFVIEDSPEMRNGYKGVHTKQSIAQFLEIVNLGTEIRVVVFTDNAILVSEGQELVIERDKENMLRHIPDFDTQTSNDLKFIRTNRTSRQLTPVIEHVISELSNHAGFDWNVLLFTSSQDVQGIPESVQKFGETPHSISILTFNTSTEWLQWYGISNTKNVIGIPHCYTPSRPCSLLTTSFITDYLVSILNDQQFSPRFLDKAAHVELPIRTGHRVLFNIEWEADQVKSVYFLVSLPLNASTTSNTVRLEHIATGAICRAKILLGYGYVIKFVDDGTDTNCSFHTGEWEAILETDMPNTKIMLDVFLEPIDNLGRLIVTPSLGLSDLTLGIYPTKNLTSVYVNIQTENEIPVVGAVVSLQVYQVNSSITEVEPVKTIILNDNGQGPDLTGNDGMYSAFLTGYSKEPAFHLLQVKVELTNDSKVVTSIQSPDAILLHDKMTAKCCGKMIKPLATTPIQSLTLQTLHLGLKTIESFEELQYPPGRIGVIKIVPGNDNDTSILVQFESVADQTGDENIILQSIEACCVPSNQDFPPTEANCADNTTDCGTFQPPGQLQTCYIDKQKLVSTFLPDETSISLLHCGLRAISANKAEGELSSGLFSVNVKAVVDAATPECNNLSDGCLPKTIFWILIGCLGLLVLIIIIILVSWCWYCSSRKKKSKVEHPPVTPRTSIPPPRSERSVYFDRHLEDRRSSIPKNEEKEPKIVKELFVNHAYIQDGDGEIKIIADSGEILRKPINNNDDMIRNHHHHHQQQITTVPISTRPISTHSISTPADNMQVFKPAPPPKPSTTTMTRSNPNRSKPKRLTSRPEIVHPNPMLRTDSIHDMSQQQQYNMQPTIQSLPPPPPQQTYSTFQPASERPDPALVYATVSRMGRLKPTSPVEKTATLPSRRVNVDPHYMVPHNSVKHIGHRQRDPLPNLHPPQVQAYPSSDTDSDMHQRNNQQHFPGRQNRYSKPPPYPAGSQLFNQNPNTFGVEGGSRGQGVVNPAVSLPPVPPPRYGVGGATNTTGRSSAPPQDHHQQQMSSDPDEDSDEWDDEDFDFNPGISYA